MSSAHTPSNTAHIPTAPQLEAVLQAALQPSTLQVVDESGQHIGHAGANGLGYGTHFCVRIAAPAFAQQPRVVCHRLVYDALRPFIEQHQGIHALAIEIIKS